MISIRGGKRGLIKGRERARSESVLFLNKQDISGTGLKRGAGEPFIKLIFQVDLHGTISNVSLGQKPALTPLTVTIRVTVTAPVGYRCLLTVSPQPSTRQTILSPLHR